jgi:predicted nucleic acid-binding protein
MEHLVIDSNILVASFIESEEFHCRSQQYINGLENGDYIFHLSMLVITEVLATIIRRSPRNRQTLLIRARKSLDDWEQDSKIILYPLGRNRMENAVNTAQQHRLRGLIQ